MLDHDYLRYYCLKENDVILDLGATGGDFAREYLSIILKKNILYIAVEPQYWNIAFLAEFLNKNLLHNSLLLSMGISNAVEKTKLFVSSSYLFHTIVEDKFSDYQYITTIDLELILKIINKNISFLKCDIEGAELDIFLSCSSDIFEKIDSMAIAAYHEIGGEKTYKKLLPYLSKFYITKYEEGILYCINRHGT